MINDDDTKDLTAAELKKLALLAKQAECLPGMLASLPYLSRNLTIGMLIACTNICDDINGAINPMLKVED